ncbi:MAG: 3-deoxy-manno-octulosonate cytidylyltransferase [Bacteroidales bacterium]
MDKNIKVIGIIPARYASTRFPGKPLALLNNQPMIQWVYEACSGVFDHLTVATDDERIFGAVEAFGGNVVMTSREHPTGTDRCLEVLKHVENEMGLKPGIVVNIQGDEPLIRKEQIEELLSCFEEDKTVIATLVQPFGKDEDPAGPDTVKVVVDTKHRALYFSRSIIPYIRNRNCDTPYPYLKHVGMYGYRAGVLKQICTLPPSPLEQFESLEQLRWMENGFAIRVKLTEYSNQGVDTPEDLEKLQNYLDDPRQESR